MPRAQCIVVRNNTILMVKHRLNGSEHWCLPGGGTDVDEQPEDAALRELKEECNVDGTIIRQTSMLDYGENDITCTYLIDIGPQNPVLGFDPEFESHEAILVDVKWLRLDELAERDRVYLWAAGLLGVKVMLDEILHWGDEISFPRKESLKL